MSGRKNAVSKHVLKIVSLFTGVEFMGILCSIVKAKFIALWLGPVGTGLFGIFNSTIETSTYLTGLGIRQGSVRDISMRSAEGGSAFRRLIRKVRSWSVVSGVLGCGLLMAMAWPLAELIFDDGSMWWTMAVISLALFFNALSAGELAIFQGTGKFRKIAHVSLLTSILGLAVSIPLFRYMGNAGVPVSLTVYALIAVALAFVCRDKSLKRERPSMAMLKGENEFVRLGLWMSAAGFVSTLCQLIFASWLNRSVSTAEVGLYTAGITIVVRYTSLVFNSVTLEYYPRVSANIKNLKRVSVFMNHEITLLLLIFTPLVLMFFMLRELVVTILYNSEFMGVIPFISLGIMTVLLRSVSNTMSFTILSKGEGRVYMIIESLDALMGLGLCIGFYNIMGLTGIGVALLVWHFIYMVVTIAVCSLRYSLRLGPLTVRTILLSYATCGIGLAFLVYLPAPVAYSLLGAGVIVYVRSFILFFRKRRKSRTPSVQ